MHVMSAIESTMFKKGLRCAWYPSPLLQVESLRGSLLTITA